MREKITNRVGQTKKVEGKTTTGKSKRTDGVIIGKLRDHELLEGWGHGRRTRKSGKNITEGRF